MEEKIDYIFLTDDEIKQFLTLAAHKEHVSTIKDLEHVIPMPGCCYRRHGQQSQQNTYSRLGPD
jgi:hypothetical protein